MSRGYVARGECRASRSCYVMGCRNECCRREQLRYVTATRLLQKSPHGTRARYDAGCRCEACKQIRALSYKREALQQVAQLAHEAQR